MSPLNKLTRTHFIHFNNIETNFNNIRYEPIYSTDDETLTSDYRDPIEKNTALTKGGSQSTNEDEGQPTNEEQPQMKMKNNLQMKMKNNQQMKMKNNQQMKMKNNLQLKMKNNQQIKKIVLIH